MKEAAIEHNWEMWERFQFWMMCTLVHEIGHLFITYLDPRGEHTPKSINHSSAPEKEAGEAGAYLEGHLFGGYILYARDRQRTEKVGSHTCFCGNADFFSLVFHM